MEESMDREYYLIKFHSFQRSRCTKVSLKMIIYMEKPNLLVKMEKNTKDNGNSIKNTDMGYMNGQTLRNTKVGISKTKSKGKGK